MEIKEHGDYLIVRLYSDDSREEFVGRMRDILRDTPNRQILLYLEDSPEHVVESMESIVAKMESQLNPTDLPDIRTLVRSDVHLGHYKGHHNLTSDCMTWRTPRPGSIPKDPSKGLNGMPRKRRR